MPVRHPLTVRKEHYGRSYRAPPVGRSALLGTLTSANKYTARVHKLATFCPSKVGVISRAAVYPDCGLANPIATNNVRTSCGSCKWIYSSNAVK
jgi:hypothetical protein